MAVIHLDADVVVVNKPAGLLTLPFERDDRDTLLAFTRVDVRRLGDPKPTLRAVQRLDKETSGLVVFARNVRGLTLQNVRFETVTPDMRPVLAWDHVSDATVNGFSVRG